MVKKICWLSLIFLFLVVLSVTTAWADLAALSYTDRNQQPATVAPARRYINPAGPISLYLAAGLERKVGYILLDSSGNTMAQGISDGIISAADQFTVLGQTYYGKILTLPATLPEGDYTLQAQILDDAGNVVATSDTTLTVALTPPTTGDLWWDSAQYTGSIMDNELVGNEELQYIKILNVNSAVGIDHVQFESFYPDSGAVYQFVSAWYDQATGTAGIGAGVTNAINADLPVIDGPLGVRFIVYDKAGNKTVSQATVRFDGKNDPAPELVAIYNPNVSTEFIPGSGLVGFVAYTPGMTTYANPMQLLYRLVRTNWAGDNPDYGLSAINGTVVYTDAQYVYYRFTMPYASPAPANAAYRFRSAQHWASYYVDDYQLALAPTAPKSPAFVSLQAYRSDTGWGAPWTNTLSNTVYSYFNTPVVISQIKVVAEARNYDQVFVMSGNGGGSCTIPAGETGCTANVNITAPPGTTICYQNGFLIQNQDGSLRSPNYNFVTEYDEQPPSITSYNLDQENKTVTFLADEPSAGSIWGQVKVDYGWLMAHNSVTNQDVKINGAVAKMDGVTYQVTVNYASLPEGNWQFTLWAQDHFQNTDNKAIDAVTLDQTPPQIVVYRDAEPLADHGSVTSLGQFKINLSDNVDPNPQLTSVQLTGGPQAIDVTLVSRLDNGAYVLEYPVMFPSGGQEYDLVVSAQDASGNVATKTLPFTYDPTQINISSKGQSTLNLPVLPDYAVLPDGGNPFSSGVINCNEAPLAGNYDLVVMSGTTSTTSLVVQGLTLAPGEQKTIPAYDFAATGGNLTLPVRADAPGRVDLLVSSAAPNFPVITAQINFWQPSLQLSADPGWAVEPLIQTQTINLVANAGTPCRLTADPKDAQTADIVNDPACLVQWTGLPANYQTTASAASGVLPASGDYTPGYEIYLYNHGQQYLAASGSGQALVAAPIQDVALTAVTTPSTSSFYRKVQNVSVALQSSGSYKCPEVTTDAAKAQQDGANQMVCLVRWTTVPDGLQDTTSSSNTSGSNNSDSVAQLTGTLDQDGNQTVGWAVDLYSPYGSLENAVSGSATLTVVDPPLPDLSFATDLYGQQIYDNLCILTNLQGGEIGMVKFGTKLLNTNMTLELTGTVEGHLSRQYTTANNVNFALPVKMGQMALWQNQPVTIKLYYTDLPDLQTEKDINVVAAPSTRIRAILKAQNQTLDSTGVPLTLQVGIPGINNQVNYDETTMGDWQAQLGYLDQKNQFQPLTDYQPLTNGVLQTTLSGFQIGFQKIEAQVQLMAPSINIPSGGSQVQPFQYTRTLLSNPAYSVVLKGTAPEGTIYSNTLSGPAPLSAVMALRVDSDTLRIMGEVDWQVATVWGPFSSDTFPQHWQKLDTKTPYQVALKLASGQYLVRARMTNQYSGEVGYTAAVPIIAYRVPELQLTAPRAVIVGTPVDLQAQVTVDGQPAADGDVVIEWYDRTGKNLVDTGSDLKITPTDYTSLIYNIRGRMASAPDTDNSSWVKKTVYVRVIPPVPPSGLLAMPGYMEYNTVTAQSYQVSAKMNLPAGLDPSTYPLKGEWHLPDGSVVKGPDLTYSPAAADAAQHQASFEYVAWIDGFQDKTTATFRRSVSVGTYSWPDFKINVSASPNVAPSLVTLTAAPTTGTSSDLQKPAYAWQLPASAVLVQKQDNGRVMQVNFPQSGTYQVGVTVTDARGSTAQATGTVILGDPPPFQVTFTPYFSNSQHRELLNVTLACHVTGGHPQDHLTDYEFSINSPDATVKSFTGSAVIQGLKAGDYQAHLHATSAMGQTVDVDYPIHVIADQPPVCKITTWDFDGYRWWQASCTDPDGIMAGYRWYKNDQLICSGTAIRIKISDLPGNSIRFHAFDDGVGVYDETVYSGG